MDHDSCHESSGTVGDIGGDHVVELVVTITGGGYDNGGDKPLAEFVTITVG